MIPSWRGSRPAIVALAWLGAATASQAAAVTVDPTVRHQRMGGWEATAWANQHAPEFPAYSDELFDMLVEDVGIDRLRLEVRSGCENDADYWRLWRDGLIPYDEWRARRYSTVDDDGDPTTIDGSGFHFSELDDTVDTVVLPIKSRLEARGERLFVNRNYVAFTAQVGAGLSYHHDDPAEYGEFVLATFLHLLSRYGWTPDALEVILEPDNVSQWDGRQVGLGLVAAGDRLAAAGLRPRMVAPSNTNMTNAVTWFDALIAVPGADAYASEISYHRYGGVSLASLQAIASRGLAWGLDTSMLEWWFGNATHHVLHEDLVVGRNSAWQQFTVDGHFDVDLTDPTSPVVTLSDPTKTTRQYFLHVRAGARRVGATSDDPDFEPVAFFNRDGRAVVVVKGAAGGDVVVDGLPPGTWGGSYATGPAEWGVELPERLLAAGDTLTATLPSAGVLTLRATGTGWLLRNDSATSLSAAGVAAVLGGGRPSGASAPFGASRPFALDVVGDDGVPQDGEGAAREAPGSDDDDDTYDQSFVPGSLDPDPTVGCDPARPLVLYRVSDPAADLRVTREPPCGVRLSW